jgi:N-methylhydantoinase B
VERVDRLVAGLFRLAPSRRYRRRAELLAAVLAELPAGFPRRAADPAQRQAAIRALESGITTLREER